MDTQNSDMVQLLNKLSYLKNGGTLYEIREYNGGSSSSSIRVSLLTLLDMATLNDKPFILYEKLSKTERLYMTIVNGICITSYVTFSKEDIMKLSHIEEVTGP